MQKAQLILVGGRSVPNILTILHEKPDIIVAITSKDAESEIPFLKDAINDLLKDTRPLIETILVDAFDVDQVKAVCEKAVEQYKDTTWLFNITNATKMMSMGAYEVAQSHPHKVRWWYLNTADTSIVTSSGKERREEVYAISVEQYLKAYYCVPSDKGNQEKEKDTEDSRKTQETLWLPFAQKLGKKPDLSLLLKPIVEQVQKENAERKKEKAQHSQVKDDFIPGKYKINALRSTISLLEEASHLGVVNDWSCNGTSCEISLSASQFQFLNGAWLEVYTWSEIDKLRVFFNCEWGKKIRVKTANPNNTKPYELDVAATYKGKLLIAECKTGFEAFYNRTLHELVSKANILGGSFVVKAVVTNVSTNDKSWDVESLNISADIAQVKIFQRDDLPQIGIKLLEIVSKGRGK